MSSESDEVQDLFDRIATCLPSGVKLKACAFRSVGVKYANEEDLISGRGASYNGGRWNPPGLAAIYASLSPVTAVKESYQEFLKFGFAPANIRPRVMVGLNLNVNPVLDLTDASIRRRLGFTLAELTGEDWHAIQTAGDESWTQAIGRGAYIAGFEGVLTPSARDRNGTNIIVFPNNLSSTSLVELMG